MQKVVIDKPYCFVPPYPGEFWVRLFRGYLPHYLKRSFGIESVEFQGLEHLRRSVAAGHGILLAANHPRPCDPFVVSLLSKQVDRAFHSMASWHVFEEGGRFRGWLVRRLGSFSVNRWGMDREALRAATKILIEARRPLIIFAEGHITRTNDRLSALLDGTAFMARTAARQRAGATPPGQVVVHPVALKYFFEGDLQATLEPVLKEIEKRLSWLSPCSQKMAERITRIGEALLALKEIEHLGEPGRGSLGPRLEILINCLLQPIEKEWLRGRREPAVSECVKLLRSAIVPVLVSGNVAHAERDRLWRQLAAIYLAQQLACYPPDYIASNPTPERLLETVERFEEDLTDVARIHRPLRVVVQVGEALPVSPEREKRGGEDPLMAQLDQRLRAMIEALCASADHSSSEIV